MKISASSPNPLLPKRTPLSRSNTPEPVDSYQPSREPLGQMATPLGTAVLAGTALAPPVIGAALDVAMGTPLLAALVGVGVAGLALTPVSSALLELDNRRCEQPGQKGLFFRPYYHPSETVVKLW